MSSKGGWLESIHLYRKVPRDLTDATRLGGLLSLMCAVVMAYLFVSNIAEYMSMTTTSDVALDDTGDVHMRLFFNITMERLPCQFATVDLADAMGTSLTNVTAEIIKFRTATEAGAKQEFYVEEPRAVKHEDLNEEEMLQYKTMPENVPMVSRGLLCAPAAGTRRRVRAAACKSPSAGTCTHLFTSVRLTPRVLLRVLCAAHGPRL